MTAFLVTLESGRMLLIDGSPSPNLAKAAAYRFAERNGMAPNVKHVSEVSEETAEILRSGEGNEELA